MIHIHCGDTSAQTMKSAGLPGEIIVWCDPLFEGPTPADVTEREWRDIRARAISRSTRGALPVPTALSWLERQDAVMESALDHDEIVLWFDACLFDQSILVRQIDWLSRRSRPRTVVSLICVGAFPGFSKFRGLGELNAGQLATLFPRRGTVTDEQVALARRAWAAWRSSDPFERFRLAREDDTSALPYLGEALLRHLQEFPSTRNGLSRLENETLEAVADGAGTLIDVFKATSEKEPRPFYGDTTQFACVDELTRGRRPLLSVDGPGTIPIWNPPPEVNAWTLSLTAAGAAALRGDHDRISEEGVDRWLGGCHLQGTEAEYRWEPDDERLIKSQTE